MKKINLYLMSLCLLLGIGVKAQTTILSENFSSASGTTPPTGWVQNFISGSTSNTWFFNNPKPRTLTPPISSPAAIFDSDYLGYYAYFHNVALESPSMNTTGKTAVRLKFDHEFRGIYNSFDSVAVEVYNGSTWNYAYSSKATSTISGNIDIDISAHAANKSNTKVRFRFVGDYSWWWIVDNVVVYEVCPATVSVQPADTAICSGNNASFSVTASGTTSVQWQVSSNAGSTWTNISNGGVYSGATTTTLSITGASASLHNNLYRCVASNSTSSCSVNSNSAKLTVYGVASTTPGFACTGGAGSVTAVPTLGSIIWYNQASGGTNLGTGNTLNIASAPASNTTYYAEVATSSNGSLTQTTGTSNGQRGAMLDIKPLTNITLTGYQFIPGGSGTYSIDIYYKVGTMIGSETNSGAWTKIASVTNLSVTTNVPQTINMTSPVALTANQVYGFYLITTVSGTIRYWNGTTVGNLWSSNADLEAYVGKGSTGVFGSTINTRCLGGTFYYTKSGPSCTNRTGVLLSVNSAPVVSAHPINSTVCNLANTSFSVTATNVASYQWQVSTNNGVSWSNVTNGGVYSNATTATLNITGATTGMHGYQYRCVLTTSCTIISNTNAATLNVNVPASVTTHPTNKILCEGAGTTFSAAGTGFGTIDFQWQVSTNGGVSWSNVSNGGVYSGATSAVLSISAATTAMNSYRYRAVLTGTCPPSATTNEALLTVNSNPAVTSNPMDVTICPTNNTSFTCSGTGTAITYQWQVSTNGGTSFSNITNGGVYSNATTATLNITGATAGMNNYQYRCRISGTCTPSATTTAAKLTIASSPTITVQPANSIICTGTTGSISFSATGYLITYQWQESTNSGSTWSNITNGGVYGGATTNTLQFTNPTLAMSGYMYRCVVTNACAVSTNTNAITLTVANSPVVNTQPANKTACIGDNTTFTVSATSSAPIAYQWQGSTNGTTWTDLLNAGIYSGVNTATLTLTNVYAGAFTMFRCELNTGCIPPATSNSATLTIHTQPNISIQPVSQTKCEGQSTAFSISATGSNLTYQWQVSTNGGSTWGNLSNGGVYTGATTSSLNLANIPVSFNSYRYRCVVTGSCPTAKTSSTAILTVNSPVVITNQPTSAVTICSGDNTSLTVAATGTGITYRWYVNAGTGWAQINNGGNYSGATAATLNINGMTAPTTTRTLLYYCQVTGTCNAVASGQTTLTIHARPNITSNPVSVTRCDSTNNVDFKVVATGTNLAYQWQLNTGSGWSNLSNNSTYSGTNTGTLLLPNVYYSMNGYQYRCVITGICTPTVTSSVATLTVNQLIAASVTISASSEDICTGTSVTFTPSPVNGGSATYLWKRNGNNVGTGSTYTSSTFANGDIVWCEMTSNAVCPVPKVSVSNQVTMKVTPYSTPTITITSDVGNVWCSGQPAVFRANITNGGQTPTYQWLINGQPVGANIDTYLTAQLLHGDQVRCQLTSSLMCPSPALVNSNTITMTINQTTRSSIVIAPNPDSVVCDKTEVTMYTFFTNGGATPAFQWMLNGQDIPGETAGTLKIKTLDNGDVINCRFISSATCVFPEISNPVTFNISPLIDPSVNVTVIYIGNDTYRFTALPVNGGPNPSYQWYKNTVPIAGATGETFDAVGLNRTDKIQVQMSSSEDCVNPELQLVTSRNLTTGLGELANGFDEIGLYPNPNSGRFNIKGTLSQPVSNKEVLVKITNALGQTVFTQVYPASGVNVDLPVVLDRELADGMYQVNITIDGNVSNLRFVLNR